MAGTFDDLVPVAAPLPAATLPVTPPAASPALTTGAFDDLVPSQASPTSPAAGAFDDLVPSQPAAPDQPGAFSLAAQGFLRGATESVTDTGKTLSGQAFTDPATPQAPATDPLSQALNQRFFDDGGYKDPKWYAAHLGHGLGASAPSLVAGAAGTLAGSALMAETGPGAVVGGIAGGAAGFGLGSALPAVASAYREARQSGLSPDEAAPYALKMAGVAGVTGAAMGALGGAGKLFEASFMRDGIGIAMKAPILEAGPLTKAAVSPLGQALVSQPLVGAAGQQAAGIVSGKPPTAEDYAAGYATNAITGGVMTAAHGALGRTDRAPAGAHEPNTNIPEGVQFPDAPVAPEQPRLTGPVEPQAPPPPAAPSAPEPPAPVPPAPAPEAPTAVAPVAPVAPAPAGPSLFGDLIPAPAPPAPPAPAPTDQVPAPTDQVQPGAPPAPVSPPVPEGAAPPSQPSPAPSPPVAAAVQDAAGTDPNLGTVTTPAGRKLDVRYEAVPAATLTAASGDLQPRDRAGRMASDAQINDIAANLDPSRLMRSTESDRGAPIVGPDNIVESGNGRVAAIRQAATQNPEGYARYVQAIKDAGHDVTGMDTPVMVARRVTDLTPDERRQSVIEHNQTATQRMSATEQAQIDGRNLTSGLLARYDHTQDPTSASNRAFVRDWVSTLPESERNGVQGGDGVLSADGVRRLHGAMLARAYDDKGVLARGLESTDDNTKNISGALVDAAPAWAKLHADIAAGKVPTEWNVAKNLTQAVDIVRQARDKKQSLYDIVNQQDAFNPIDPVTEQFVRAMYSPDGKSAASRPALAKVLQRYSDEGANQSTGGDMFGAAPKPIDALKAIVSRRTDTGERTVDTQGSLLGPKKPEPPPVAPAPAPDPAAPPAPEPAPAKPPVPSIITATKGVAWDSQLARLERSIIRLQYDRRALMQDHVTKDERNAKAIANIDAKLAPKLRQLGRLLKAHDAMTPAPAAIEPTKLAADSRPLESGTTSPAPAPTGTGATRPPMGGKRGTAEFNEGTSPYNEVFRDAGLDPRLMTSRPIAEQVRVIADQVQKTFGFKNIEIHERQPSKEVRDQLANFYQNAREMAAALGMPYDAIGLNGRLSLTTKPFHVKDQALGTYAPKGRVITIAGRSNAFAHEWTHALDHYLSDVLARNPNAMRYLSETKATSLGRPGGPIPVPGSSAEAFVNVMQAIFGKDAATAAEALRLQFEARSNDPAVFRPAQARLAQLETDFRKGALSTRNPAYWARPAELLARAHEAYVGHAIEAQGGDTRAVAALYYDSVDPKDVQAKYYPQAGERMTIFGAFRDLHLRLAAEAVHGPALAGARPSGLDVMDPNKWHKITGAPLPTGVRAMLRRELDGFSNFRARFLANLGYNPDAADPGASLRVTTRAADVGRAATFSIRGYMDAIVARTPAGPARAAFQELRDKLIPAEHVRSAAEASGRTIGPTFEHDVRAASRGNTNKLTNILAQHGLAWHDLTATQTMLRDVQTEKLMLRHLLTEGKDDDFVAPGSPAGKATPVPEHIKDAAVEIRHLLDEEWERNRAAGMDVGYAKSGWFPRIYDDTKIMGDSTGFRAAADTLHRLMFEQAVGDDPSKLLEAHDRMDKDVRDGLPQTVKDQVAELRANLKAQDKIASRIEDGTSKDPAQDQDKLDDLRDKATELHDALRDPVRDAFADAAASDWYHRINAGDPTDYETRGPSSNYTRKRVLPAEADTIMRDFMVNDPTQALPRYFQQSARRVAFIKRFGGGADGSIIDKLMRQASEGGARGEDIATMRMLINTVTGRMKTGLPQPVVRGMTFIHAMGTLALMPRAVWSSLAEPVAVLARTDSFKVMFKAFANQFGDIARTADSKTRAELANALGITVSYLHDSVIADRTDAHYSDAPGLSTLMTNFYRTSGLTQLTNSQRRSVMGAGHMALDAWSKDILSGSTSQARDAAAQFRDLGIADKDHKAFAEWVIAHPGLPSLADLASPGGHTWGHAITSLTDKIIQDPMRGDKPLMSQNPVGRLMYGLMGFNYAFFHNIVEHRLALAGARTREAAQDAKDAGAGRAGAAGAGAKTAAREIGKIGVTAGAIFAASLAVSTLREAIFNHDKWKEHAEDGTLTEWLSDLALARTGFNGPLDPVAQAITGLKYERDLSGLLAGAQMGYFLQAAGDMLKPLSAGSPDTNTARYNAVKGAVNFFVIPAIAAALSAVGGGPITRGLTGGAMQALTSRGAVDAAATAAAGVKGSANDGTPPSPKEPRDPFDPPEEKKGTGSGLLGGVPIGIADDLAMPAVRVAIPLWSRLPVVGKYITGAVAAAGGVSALAGALANHPKEED